MQVSVNGSTVFSASAAGVTNSMAFDALGRQILSETLSGGDGSPSRPPRVVSSSTRYNAIGQ